MFCPNCGKESLDGKNFCSTCGTNLYSVKQVLESGLLPSTPDQPQTLEGEVENPRYRKFKSIGFLFIALGVIYAMAMGIASNVVEDFSYRAARLLENLIGFCAIFITSGIFTMIYGRIMHRSQPLKQNMQEQKSSRRKTSELNNQPSINNTRELPPTPHTDFGLYTPPSVTEHTTFHLKEQQNKRTKE
ncbi:MAG: zinc ribbon domain-containing protein [Blastocatellia bacterium]|nr:zinc ribbon domain-containing protein [Blastocatellia bacterium]